MKFKWITHRHITKNQTVEKNYVIYVKKRQSFGFLKMHSAPWLRCAPRKRFGAPDMILFVCFCNARIQPNCSHVDTRFSYLKHFACLHLDRLLWLPGIGCSKIQRKTLPTAYNRRKTFFNRKFCDFSFFFD